MTISATHLLAAALLGTITLAQAQTYPARPVRVVVGFAPGGSTDVTARIMAQELTKLWTLQVVVDNRPGASGMIGADLAAKARARRLYAAGVAADEHRRSRPLLFPKMPYDSIGTLQPSASSARRRSCS